jgi:flagellar basal body-associated protein FliL
VLIESNNKDKRTVVIISVSVAFGALLLASIGFGWFFIRKGAHLESKGKYITHKHFYYFSMPSNCFNKMFSYLFIDIA